MKRSWLSLCGVLVMLAVASAAGSDRTSQIHQRIARVESGLLPPVVIKGQAVTPMKLAERMAHYHVPGVSVAVINNGAVEWARGYGLADTEARTPVTPNTRFQAASISKPVTAVAAMHLVEAGTLNLDEDVNRKLVSWKVPENGFTAQKKVTIRELMSHSAGITVSGFPGYAAEEPVPTLLQVLRGEKPANTAPILVDLLPATRWRYSGGGCTILQQLLVDVTGKAFPALLQQEVLGKLGMTHSTFEQPPPQRLQSSAATAYSGNGKAIAGRWHIYPEMAAAGLWTTPSDLARFAAEVQCAFTGKSTKILSAAGAREMLTPQIDHWGLGFALAGKDGEARFSHSGGNEGFRCHLVAYEQGGIGAAVMTNSDNGSDLIFEILRGIAKEYGWPDFAPREKAMVTVDPKSFAQFAGLYEIVPGFQATITAENGKLYVQADGDQQTELFVESEATFFAIERDLEITFVRDAHGRATDIVARLNSQEWKGKRIK